MNTVLSWLFTVVAVTSIVGVLCIAVHVVWGRFVDGRELLVMMLLVGAGSVAAVASVLV